MGGQLVVGEKCEGLTSKGEWKPGVITKIDQGKEETPFHVRFDDGSEEWPRKVTAHPAKAWKIAFNSHPRKAIKISGVPSGKQGLNGTYEYDVESVKDDGAPVYKRTKLHDGKPRFLYFATDRTWRVSGPKNKEGRKGGAKGSLCTEKENIGAGYLPHRFKKWKYKTDKGKDQKSFVFLSTIKVKDKKQTTKTSNAPRFGRTKFRQVAKRVTHHQARVRSVQKMKMRKLREELTQRGEDDVGKKSQLQARLLGAMDVPMDLWPPAARKAGGAPAAKRRPSRLIERGLSNFYGIEVGQSERYNTVSPRHRAAGDGRARRRRLADAMSAT